MIYKAKKDTKCTMTRYEKKVIKRLRKISILKKYSIKEMDCLWDGRPKKWIFYIFYI